jgi:hypothetical protein
MSTLDQLLILTTFVICVICAFKYGYNKAWDAYHKTIEDLRKEAAGLNLQLTEAIKEIDISYREQLEEFKSDYRNKISKRLKTEYDIVFIDKN